MNEGNLIQTPAQDAVGDLNEPNANPTPITHDAGGPNDPISEPDTEDPVMQFVVHNFDRMNAMYKAFTQKLKGAPQQQAFANAEPPVIEPWNSDLDDLHLRNVKENAFIESDNADPSKSCATIGGAPPINTAKGKLVLSNDFYHQPFIFREAERDVRDLVASPFTKRIRDYDMPDGIKVPTNLRTYDGTTDPDDHLTVFMGTVDIHKLLEPAWCRFFQITLSGAARFWYDNLAPSSIDGFHLLRDKFRANFLQQIRFQKTQAEILGIRQQHEESLKDYVARFSEETLHMATRSDTMVYGAFISGLRPGRLFKDLIAKPPSSLEDLFTQTHNFIRAEDVNNENRLREPRRETKQHMTYKDLPRRSRDKHIPRPATRQVESYRLSRDNFTALIKSPVEILATSEGKTMLRPPPKMFTPANKRGRTKYCEFHGDHGHETNDCIDLRKEIEACVKKPRVPTPNITFSKDDLIPEHCTSDNPLIITADVGTTHIHIIYVDGGSSAEIMYKHCFEQLTPEEKKEIRPPTPPLVGFAGQISWPLGITLPVTKHDYRVSQKRDHLEEASDTEGVERIIVNNAYPEQTLQITANLPKMLKEKLCEFLCQNKDIFAWKLRGQHSAENIPCLAEKASHSQRTKLMVKKADETWRTCIDFMNLNKAYPKDSCPLPEIDQKIESLEAKSTERSLPFFKTLKGCLNKKDFQWSTEAETAFQELKSHLQSLPALTIPRPKETLVLYLATATEAVSAVLFTDKGNVQRPIYFMSKKSTTLVSKKWLALVHAARRLRRYFQAHTVCVLTDQPIKQVLLKPENSDRLAKWAIKLGEHEIIYKPRSAIKGQVLADFLAESPTNNNNTMEKAPHTFGKDRMPTWTLFTDDASSIEGSGAGLILTDPNGQEITYTLRFKFRTSNNKSEYEALLAGLELAIQMEAKRIDAYTDEKIFIQKLPIVLWAYQTTIRTGTGCTPFSLVFGSEAVLPPKIGLSTHQINIFDSTTNDMNLRLNLDLLEERRELAALRTARYKRHTERHYNTRVKHNHLKIGDSVLRKNEASRQEGQKKLDPNWEGPYQVIDAKSTRTYTLADIKGHLIS
ncbi:reverse transcriptase domain-containing protein [Tanacetum coccineum]|uniref:Reverse transcriptase domain-containing protein n=1 Tax=Tanacetum coccineum TaxID=301880 RepID=A0ABQ5HUA7_9ASTR